MDKFYSISHEWVMIDDDTATVGITKYAVKLLEGDITYVRLPREGKDVIVSDRIALLENVSAASDVYSPISGTICEVNTNLADDPGLASRSPEECGWICRMNNIDPSDLDELMTESEYKDYLKSL